ncbi:hypothetical protein BDV33DRAFT_195535 [Aspergillus novoparasiticus]|uniref:Rhodopsin domain-containing protein n=1 Tax=Aspergillus novoparasiticus TaxID=986946 RepID=A0A5N6EE51_9EURO|nr:hypothetical protein BDV33DRAFT_195535 [Aspergillus novoparasiticus]
MLVGRSKSIFVVTLIFLCISLTTVALRCYVRLRLVRRFGWDDALMVLAMALNIWFATCGLTGSVAGIGRKLDDFDRPQEIEKALFWWWLGQSAYVWVVTIARLSIAMLLLRIAIRRRDSIVTYVVMSLTVAVGLPFWLVLMLQCQPVREFWQRTGGGYCIDTEYIIDVAYLYSATACLCDFTLGLYPIYLIRNLQITGRSKWALAGILGLGCVASAAVVVRIPFLPNYKDTDFLFRPSNNDRSHGSQVALDTSWPGNWRSDLGPEGEQFVSTTVTTPNARARRHEAEGLEEGEVISSRINVQRTFDMSR